MVDADGETPEQVDAIEGISRELHLLLELVDATHFPLLEERGVKLADACEMGIEDGTAVT